MWYANSIQCSGIKKESNVRSTSAFDKKKSRWYQQRKINVRWINVNVAHIAEIITC